MIFKFLNSETKTITSAAIIVGVLSCASRVVGLIRDRILAGEFGAGDTLDVYYAAFKLPDLLFSLLIVGALSASFIPLFTKYYFGMLGKDKAWKFTNNVLNILGIFFVLLSVILFIFAQPLANLIAPGFDLSKRELVADFTRVMLLAELILGLSVVFGSVLQATKRFLLYSLAPILYNVGIVIGALLFVGPMGAIGLAWGVVLGAFLHFLLQLYGVLQNGYSYRWIFDWRDRDMQEVFRLMGPRLLGLGVQQFNIVVMTVIASGLAIGSVTVFNFAYNIQYFSIGIIGVAYAVAAFPTLCEYAEQKRFEHFVDVLSSTIRQVLFLIVPMMLLFLILRAQIVRVVVGAGAFDWEATILTADTLAFFSLGFFAQAIVLVLARAYFALRDTVTPFAAGLVSAVVNVFAGLWLSDKLGVAGLGAAATVSVLVNLVLLWAPLRSRLGTLNEFRLLKTMYVITVAGMLSGVAMQFMKGVAVMFVSLNTFFGVLAQGLIAGGTGLIVYGFVAWILKSEEMKHFVSSFQRRFLKKYQPEEAVRTETTVS